MLSTQQLLRTVQITTATLTLAGTAYAQVSGDIVKIGILTDLSGVYSDGSGKGNIYAAQLAIDDFGGKVLGKKIELVSADTQNKPDIASIKARQWLDVDGVDAMFDFPGSAVALAVQTLGRDKGAITVAVSAVSPVLYGKECSPTGFLWAADTYGIASVVAQALVKQGGDTWFFLTLDQGAGPVLQNDTTRFINAAGGKVIGSVRHPLNAPDFSSYIVQAQASKANVIAFANAGNDSVNAVKQANEYNLSQSGQKIAALVMGIGEVHAAGLDLAKGLYVAESFYWATDDATRAWTARWKAKGGVRPPNMFQAGTYSAVNHYLKAVQAAGTDNPKQVAAKMKELRVNDFYSKDLVVRDDGRVVRPMQLFQVKSKAESTAQWDYYKPAGGISGEQSIVPIEQGQCAFIKK